jgi:hypothetical protein
MFRNLEKVSVKKEPIQSYLGMLSHGNGYKLKRRISLPIETHGTGEVK